MDKVYEFLLHMDIDTLAIWCYKTKSNPFCHDAHFWIEKFKHDGLTIMNKQKTLSGWIKEYKAVAYATHQLRHVIDAIDNMFDHMKINLPIIDVSHFKSYDQIPFLPQDYINLFDNYLSPVDPPPDVIETTVETFDYDDDMEISMMVDYVEFEPSMDELKWIYYHYFYYTYTHNENVK